MGSAWLREDVAESVMVGGGDGPLGLEQSGGFVEPCRGECGFRTSLPAFPKANRIKVTETTEGGGTEGALA